MSSGYNPFPHWRHASYWKFILVYSFVQNLLRAWKLWWDVHKQAELAHQHHSLGRQVGKMMPECTVSCSFSVLIATTRTDFMGKESLKHGVDMLYFISVWHMGQRLFCNPDMVSCLSPLCVVNSAQIWLLSFPQVCLWQS